MFCPGPPAQVISLSDRLNQLEVQDIFQNNPAEKILWDEEYRRTVTEPMRRPFLAEGVSLDNLSLSVFTKYADEGDAVFAYIAGARFKNRLLGGMRGLDGTLVADNRGEEYQLGVLQTDKLAFKYLGQSAEAGHGIAMQSLADCYENGTGVQKSMRMCRENSIGVRLYRKAQGH